MAESERRSVIDKEHDQLILAIKREYGVSNLSLLSESNQKECRCLIREMWSKENGLNDKGRLYISEGFAPLNENTSDENIAKRFKREVKLNVDEICKCIASGSDCPVLKKIKSDIETQISKKISIRDVKLWTLEVCAKHMSSKMSSIKF